MKILFIYPPITPIKPNQAVKSHPPIGLLCLATYIKSIGHQVKIIDALAEKLNWLQIKKRIKKYSPKVIGLSVMFTAYYQDALNLSKRIKNNFPDIKIILGGAHVSINPNSCFQNNFIDFVIFGEGEKTLENLLQKIDDRKKYSTINGLVYRQGKKIKKNHSRELIKNLDELPFPDWNLLKLNKYKFDDGFQMRKPCFIVETSRGCPNHCVYCSAFAVWQHHWRGRSPQNVVDEIEILVKKFGAKEIAFLDDTMSLDKKRMIGICNELINRKINIKWSTPNGIAHWTISKPLLKLMKKAGCYKITFGIESGDPSLRRWIGKPYSLNEAQKLTQYANKLGLWTNATNIIGFPYETMEQIQKTLNYSLESDVDIAYFFRLGLRPGAPVYDIFEKEGLLPKNKKLLFYENKSCNTKNFTGNQLVQIQKEMYNEFYKKRWGNKLKNILRIKNKIKNIEDLFYTINQIKNIKNLENGWVSQKSIFIKKQI